MNGCKTQQGMVLALVMILILPLTLMALTVMQSGREQMKMSAASSHRLSSLQSKASGLQQFWLQKDLRQRLKNLIVMDNQGTPQSKNTLFVLERSYTLPCMRTIKVSSLNIVKRCHYMTISLQDLPAEKSPAVILAELPLVSSLNLKDIQ